MRLFDIEKLKEIQQNIEMTPPTYDEIIDKEKLKSNIWPYRLSSTDVRKNTFMGLVTTTIDTALFTWKNAFQQNKQYKLTLDKMEKDLKKEEKDLLQSKKTKETFVEGIEKKLTKIKTKIHNIELLLINYSDKFAKNNSMKKITLIMMMVFSILMAGGTAMLLNKIGTQTEQMQKVLSGENSIQTPIVQTVQDDEYDEYSEETNQNNDKKLAEIVPEVQKGEIEKSDEIDWKQTFMFFLYSLIFLGLGKVVSIAYEELDHPRWILYGLVIGVIAVTIPLVYVTVEQLKNIVTQKKDKAEYDRVLSKCIDIDISDYSDPDSFKCIAWSNRKTDELTFTKALDSQLQTYKIEKAKDDNGEDASPDYLLDSEAKKIELLFLTTEYRNLENKLYADSTFMIGLQKMLMFFAEMLFSSIAWVYFVRIYTSEKMTIKLKKKKEKFNKDIEELLEKENSYKNEIIETSKIIKDINSNQQEVILLKSKILPQDKIVEQVKLLKEQYINHSLVTLQEIETWIIIELAKPKKEDA